MDLDIVRDVSKSFVQLEEGPEKSFVLGVMQGIMICREQKEKPVTDIVEKHAG